MKNILVYVADMQEVGEGVYAESIEQEKPEAIREVVRVATEQETVYTLQQFESMCNWDMAPLTNSWVVIRNKNVKV